MGSSRISLSKDWTQVAPSLCSLGFVLRPQPSPPQLLPPQNKDTMASLGRQFAGQVNYQSVRMTPFALRMSHLIFGIKSLPHTFSFSVARGRFMKVRSLCSSVHSRLPGTQPISRATTSSSVLLSEPQTCTQTCTLSSRPAGVQHTLQIPHRKTELAAPFQSQLMALFSFSLLYGYLIAQARTRTLASPHTLLNILLPHTDPGDFSPQLLTALMSRCSPSPQ